MKALLLALALSAGATGPGPGPREPADLGPETIDVSSYPEEYQQTYRDIFLPVYKFHGGVARAINSPLVELDEHLEAQERREHPDLFSDTQVAQVSRDGWKKSISEIYRKPACCGACPVLSLEKARKLWRFVVYDSIQRKTGRKAATWALLRKDLVRRFDEEKIIHQESGK